GHCRAHGASLRPTCHDFLRDTGHRAGVVRRLQHRAGCRSARRRAPEGPRGVWLMDLKELYRDVILDHNKRPRNFGRLETPDAHADGHNPLCGDRLSVFVKMNGDQVEDLRFEGKGCAISTASASLMTEAVKGKDKAAIGALFAKVHNLLTQQDAVAGTEL